MPLRFDHFHIDRHEMVGNRLRVDGYLSRTGVQVYDQGDGTVQREQRDASEVFHPDALASMRGMPVTVGHPKLKMVDGNNWRKFAHGHVGDDVRKAEDGIHTKASLWISDAATQKRIIDGELTELSTGYFADLDETPGRNDKGEDYDVRQIVIRGNHQALLQDNQARGGRGCRIRLDSSGDAVLETDTETPPAPTAPAQRRELMKLKIRADRYDYEVEAENDQLVTALRKDREAEQAKLDAATEEVSNVNAELETTKAALDAANTEKTELQAKLDAFEADQAKGELDAIIARAKKLGGDNIDTTGSANDIKLRALNAAGIKDVDGVSIDEKPEAYIDARFDIAIADAAKKAKRHDPLSRARQAVVDADDGDNGRADVGEPMNLTGELHDRLAERKEAN